MTSLFKSMLSITFFATLSLSNANAQRVTSGTLPVGTEGDKCVGLHLGSNVVLITKECQKKGTVRVFPVKSKEYLKTANGRFKVREVKSYPEDRLANAKFRKSLKNFPFVTVKVIQGNFTDYRLPKPISFIDQLKCPRLLHGPNITSFLRFPKMYWNNPKFKIYPAGQYIFGELPKEGKQNVHDPIEKIRLAPVLDNKKSRKLEQGGELVSEGSALTFYDRLEYRRLATKSPYKEFRQDQFYSIVGVVSKPMEFWNLCNCQKRYELLTYLKAVQAPRKGLKLSNACKAEMRRFKVQKPAKVTTEKG